MDEQMKKRVRRTPEQLAAGFDEKIAKLNQDLAANENKREAAMQSFDRKATEINAKIEEYIKRKEAVLAPKPRRKPRKTKKQKIDEIVKLAVKSGLKPDEVAEKLGIDVSRRTSQSLCKPPVWCRIEAPHRRNYI